MFFQCRISFKIKIKKKFCLSKIYTIYFINDKKDNSDEGGCIKAMMQVGIKNPSSTFFTFFIMKYASFKCWIELNKFLFVKYLLINH